MTFLFWYGYQPLGRSTNWITFEIIQSQKLQSAEVNFWSRKVWSPHFWRLNMVESPFWLLHFAHFYSHLGPNISTEPGVSQNHPRIDLLRKDSLCQCAMDPIGWLAKLVNLVEFNGWFFWRKAMTSWKIMKSQTRVWVYGFVKYMEDSGSTKSIEISLTHFKVLAV